MTAQACLTIAGARLIDPEHGLDIAPGAESRVHIHGDQIAGVGEPPVGFVAERVIDATGHVLIPGLIDLAARLREPGYEYKATLESEMRAAIAGGVTTLACPPDTDPVLDEPGLVEMLKHRARGIEGARLYPIGALTVGLKGETLTEMAELVEAGCVGFSQALAPITDTQVLLRAMQYARTFGFRLWLQPQDPHLSRGGVAHSGPYASRLGLSGVPVIAETVALHTLLELVSNTGCSVHLLRVSSAAGIELIRQARRQGLPVTCDVSAHHLHMTDLDIGFFDSNCRVDPPFRSERDRAAIRAGLVDGTIDAVCSDHTPVDDDAKLLPFAEAEPGVTGLELLLPLVLKWSQESQVPLTDALRRVTSGPARVIGLEPPALRAGARADLCLFDPDHHWTVSRGTLQSQGAHTPYLGRSLQGRVRMTWVAGREVWCERSKPA